MMLLALFKTSYHSLIVGEDTWMMLLWFYREASRYYIGALVQIHRQQVFLVHWTFLPLEFNGACSTCSIVCVDLLVSAAVTSLTDI